jgi:soluble lytic murein transglycosylase
MTTAAAGHLARVGRRRSRFLPVVLVIVALMGAWLAVHLTMPSFYARWWYPLEHTDAIRGEAAANGLEPELVAAVIYRESKFAESARSARGAVGLMQVMPETAYWISHQPGAPSPSPQRLAEPAVNIAYGAWYLAYLEQKYGDTRRALAAYNGGEANLRRWLAAAQESGRSFRITDVPFAETRSFVLAVEDAEATYRRVWRGELG